MFSSEMELGSILGMGALQNNENSIRTKDYIRIKPNTTYSMQNDKSYTMNLYYYDKNKTFISASSTNGTFTTPNNAYYFKTRTNTALVQNDLTVKYMLVEGSTATPYKPYTTQTYTIPCQQPMRSIGDVRDKFVRVNGSWYERHYITYIPSYNGEVITTEYMSTTGQLTTGAKVQYVETTPTDLPCTTAQTEILEQIYNEAKTYEGGTHIYSTDETSPYFEIEYFMNLNSLVTRIEKLEGGE